jgi:CheY-like chemotaxis protein
MTYAKSCLLIDDDHDDQFVFSLAIKALNKSILCTTVNDGFAALKKLEQDPLFRPDLIFLDLNLPGINGFDFLSRIKTNAALSHIPVVIYTTSSREEDIIKTKNLGAAGFITKPYHITDLTATLKDLFNVNTAEG